MALKRSGVRIPSAPPLRERMMAIQFGEFLAKHGLSKVTLNLGFATAELNFEETDRDAAWDLYVEMLTRITTQPLPSGVGDEQTALSSVYSLFATTREILRHRGRRSIEFSKVAIPVLNQVVRPFTAKWHREAEAGAFEDPARCEKFRTELASLQLDLRKYNRMLAEIAEVEDLTDLESQRDDA